MGDGLGAWDPMSVSAVERLMEGAGFPWWVAGGWAIDLHVGHTTRPHDDTDILVLRDDLPRVQRRLTGWDLYAADPPGILRKWGAGETLSDEVHDIWCRRTKDEPWSLQLMVDRTQDGEWVYRRDIRVRRAVPLLYGPASTRRLPVLAPEVQLLYKSGAPRPKDEADFRAVHETLNPVQRTWLNESLAVVSPDHPWLAT